MEPGPFRDIVATFLFMALVNRPGKKRNEGQIVKVSDAHGKLYNTIQNITGSPENIMFWSGNQKLMLEGEYKHIRFDSTYGTGNSSEFGISCNLIHKTLE